MDIKYHSEAEKKFSEHLLSLGYTKDSILYEPAFLPMMAVGHTDQTLQL